MINANIIVKKYMDYVREKAVNTYVSIAKIIPNIGSQRYRDRLLMARVVGSTLLCAAPI